MKLTEQETLQAITDALGAFAIAMSRQMDSQRLMADLRNLAEEAASHDRMPSAGLLDEIVRTLEARSSSKTH